MTQTLDLATLTLKYGGHDPDDGEMCLLEAAAYMAGEDWSDHPECVCPVLGAMGRGMNDAFGQDAAGDARRAALVPLLPELLGTAGDGHAGARSYLALDWLVRTYLPTWLRLVPALTAQAELLAAHGPIVDLESAAAIGDMVREAASQASAAWAAAWAAAGAAARAAARAADGAAAWAAARAAAGDAAWAADGDAARAAAGAAAGAAARAAARAADGDAAGAAAWAAAGDAARAAARAADGDAAGAAAWAAAGDAARAALNPTVAALQDSAIELYARMIRIGLDTPPAVAE